MSGNESVEVVFESRRNKKSTICWVFVKENALLIGTLVAVVLGIVFGIVLRLIPGLIGDEIALLWIGFPGEIFLRALMLLILPLVVSCVVTVIAKSDLKANGKMGILAFVYIFTTNMVAGYLGVVLVAVVNPGSQDASTDNTTRNDGHILTTSDILTDLIRNLIPNNFVKMAFTVSQTTYKENPQMNKSDPNETATYTRSNGESSGMNILGILFTSVIFGMAASSIGEDANVFIKFFDVLMQISIKLLTKVIWFLPIGLFSLITVSLLQVKDLATTFSQLGIFMATIIAALAIDQFGLLLVMYLIFVRKNPFPFYWKILKAYLVAFSAGSSTAALPVMLTCADSAGITQHVSRFVLPLCCSTNSDGSCAFIAGSVVFLAQLTNTPLNFGTYILIGLLSGISGLSLPSVPSSSIIVIISILSNLNIPASAISLLYTGEFLLDRLRTGCNTWSHCTCAASIDARITLPNKVTGKTEVGDYVSIAGTSSSEENGHNNSINGINRAEEDDDDVIITRSSPELTKRIVTSAPPHVEV